MTDEEYFARPEISNSSISKLEMDLGMKRNFPDDIEETFEFGTLVHHLILEPEKADVWNPDYQKARDMRDAVLVDSLANMVLTHKDCKKEHVFIKKIAGIWCRMKADGALIIKHKRIGVELKSTFAKTEKQFMQAIHHFDYDRQFAFYMDIGRFQKHLILAVSKYKDKKGKHPVFKLIVERNSELYRIGKQKYLEGLELVKKHNYKKINETHHQNK